MFSAYHLYLSVMPCDEKEKGEVALNTLMSSYLKYQAFSILKAEWLVKDQYLPILMS